MKRNILVFGVSGEIGGRIARGCADSGHAVTGVCRGLNTQDTVCLDGITIIHGDKADEAFVQKTLSPMDFDTIIDSVPTMNSVEMYHRHFGKARNVLICSSTGTFVPLSYYPADENHPWRDETRTNFHDQSVRDARALELWETEGFPVTIFRPTNIIGRDRVPLELWGGRDIEFFRKLKKNLPVMIPPCEQVLLQSGSNTDLADAFVKSLDYPAEVRGEIFIISCRKAITLGRYLETAMEYLGSKSEILVVSPENLLKSHPEIQWRFGLDFLLEHMCFDISKAEKTFGYQPQKTAEDGLHDALSWCESCGLL